MSTQLITPSPSTPSARRHIQFRIAAIIAAVVVTIAAAGSLAITTIDHNVTAPTLAAGATASPTFDAMRQLHQRIASQYSNRSAAGTATSPSAQATHDVRNSIAGQYGSKSSTGIAVSPGTETLRELRHRVASRYGPAR